MTLDQFAIGMEFSCGGRRWRCTDIGTRTIAAIRVDAVEAMRRQIGGEPQPRPLDGAEAVAEGWFNGPPYAVAEIVFDEDDQTVCEPVEAG